MNNNIDNDSIDNNNIDNDSMNNTIAPILRRQMGKQRRQLSSHQRQHAAAHASLWLHKLTTRLPKNARVGIYYDGFGEMPTQPLLAWCQRHGFRAFLPIVGSWGQTPPSSAFNPYKRLRFTPIASSRLINIPTYRHKLGMQQQHGQYLLEVHQLDVLFCPLVAVDKVGTRMGMGGGYYDATLSKSHRLQLPKPLIIGWCYDFQVVDALPKKPWDVPMDMVVTPSGIRWGSF